MTSEWENDGMHCDVKGLGERLAEWVVEVTSGSRVVSGGDVNDDECEVC
jgi:hypothetical protein